MCIKSCTVIILSCDRTGLLLSCLHALEQAISSARQLVPSFEIVVVDNAGRFPIAQPELPGSPKLIRVDTHHSFAAANNLAAKGHPAESYLLLNNDVFLHPGALTPLFDLLTKEPRTGIVGTRLHYPDGSVQHAGVGFGEIPDGGGSHIGIGNAPATVAQTVQHPQAVTGACMLIRDQTWQQLEGLSLRYDFGSEDVDFCLRAGQHGWRIACCPGPSSLHLEASTPGRIERDVPSRIQFTSLWKEKITHDIPS
ncbi:glycosyltransferase [Kiritimatiellota bacterium B12222]|nr:glycosyltransferase [Kiritimatiellota bacterium B12222]